MTPEQATQQFLMTGEHDMLHAAWPGSGHLERMRNGDAALRSALIAEIRQRARNRDFPSLPLGFDADQFVLRKVEPMVRGLFPVGEWAAMLTLFKKSLVFVTHDTIEQILSEIQYMHSAWQIANLYLGSLDLPGLDGQPVGFVGLSEETTFYLSMAYFEDRNPYADWVVHEAAHVFHNWKRDKAGLPHTRTQEFLLSIAFAKRELFAYACEAYARILAQAKSPADRRRLHADYAANWTPDADGLDRAELVDVLAEAVNARNGWLHIRQRCGPPQAAASRRAGPPKRSRSSARGTKAVAERNRKILRLSRSGVAISDIARQFRLSRASIDNVVCKAKADCEQALRNASALAQVRAVDDLDMPWPISYLLDALVPRTMTRKALLRYWDNAETVCLRDLMDMIVSDTPDPRTGYLISPLLDVRCAGIEGLWSTVEHISNVDLGPCCNAAWQGRLALLEGAQRIKGDRQYSWSKPIRRLRQSTPGDRGQPVGRDALRPGCADVTFRTCTFAECVNRNPELVALRATYASKTAEERRLAADWAYHSTIASHAFNQALGAGETGLDVPHWPDGVVALAIDPSYAPAILTVGSIEYQLGRQDEAMSLFLTLTTLPLDDPELSTIIDKAGEFLIHEQDYGRARDLYAAADEAFPDTAIYSAGLGYCFGKLGRYEDAVSKAERVIELDPDNHEHLNDLGWALYQAGDLHRAESALEQSVALAPRGYEVAWNNLEMVSNALRKANP